MGVEAEIALVAVAGVIHHPLVALEMSFLNGEEVQLIARARGKMCIGARVANLGTMDEIQCQSCAGQEEFVLAGLDQDAAAAGIEMLLILRVAQIDAGTQPVAQRRTAQVIGDNMILRELEILLYGELFLQEAVDAPGAAVADEKPHRPMAP